MEMLVVVSIIAFLGIAVYNALSSGVRLWKKSRRFIVEQDIAVFFDKISSDLRNTSEFSLIPFKGKAARISFPSLVKVPMDSALDRSGERLVTQIGQVEYYFDSNSKSVMRRQANYSQSLKSEFGRARGLVKGVDGLSFKYWYVKDSGIDETSETLDIMPSGVEVVVDFSDGWGSRSMIKLINFPVGS